MTADIDIPVDEWLAFVCQGSELGSLVLAHDWAATPLGPPSTWDSGLRTAVSTCLTSRFPILVTWGPELIKIYNDGYRQLLGQKHPRALGAPAREIWPEVWDQLGPEFEQVMKTGRPTWHDDSLLVLERNGYPEECFFVWGYSPLFDESGRIGGVIDVVTETTEKVLARRRLECLMSLSAALLDADQVTDVCLRAASALSNRTPDIRGVDLYLRIGEEMARMASSGRSRTMPLGLPQLLDVVHSGRALVSGGEVGDRPASTYAMPLSAPRSGVDGVMVVSLSPQRPLDESYARFLDLLGAVVGAALDGAVRRAKELGAYREIADTLQGAMLEPSSNLPTVAARYRPAEGRLAVGGDWYDVVDLGGSRRGLVVGDCVGHGLRAATVMGQLRSASRMMLLEGADPAAILQALDGFASTIPGADGTTMVCVIVDRAAATITYASAGHLPPLVIGHDGPRWLNQAQGMPLAVHPAVARTNVTEPLVVGDVILLYTDGLVERRGEVIDIGLNRLAQAAEPRRDAPVQELADALLAELSPSSPGDDVVLVVKHFDGN